MKHLSAKVCSFEADLKIGYEAGVFISLVIEFSLHEEGLPGWKSHASDIDKVFLGNPLKVECRAALVHKAYCLIFSEISMNKPDESGTL
jgi:hypothetical protein